MQALSDIYKKYWLYWIYLRHLLDLPLHFDLKFKSLSLFDLYKNGFFVLYIYKQTLAFSFILYIIKLQLKI